MKLILAPSILAADFKALEEQIRQTDVAGAKYLHFDVMDGHFVPNISFGPPVLSSICGITKQVMDVHMMVDEPIRFVKAFKQAGADHVTIHLEACNNVQATIDYIHQCGMTAGISIKPGTKVKELVPFLNKVERFLIMSVEPGFGGQEFLPNALGRISELRGLLEQGGLVKDIQVDGGISHNNVEAVVGAGANVIVAGSAVFRGDIRANTEKFKEIFEQL